MKLVGKLPKWFQRDEAGQGLAEYALILAFVALAVVGAMTTLGGTIAASSAWTIP
jgi:Flp pilus assembly pilin Flp